MTPLLHGLKAAALAAPLLLAPALAQDMEGDADSGETLFGRNCISCHVIADGDGETLAGRQARTGPNLYGVMGAEPGTAHDFAYSPALIAYGETGVIWEEENTTSYLLNPTAHLRDALEDPGARGRMTYQMRSESDARDVAAFLARFPAGTEETESDEDG
ncbi:MAG: c-type cytochrome [Pararhodobacter sp.]